MTNINIRIARELNKIAKELVSVKITKKDDPKLFLVYADDVFIKEVTLIRKKSGRKRPVWKGTPAKFMAFFIRTGVGIINDGSEWFVELLTEKGRRYTVTMDEYLKSTINL